MKIMTSESVARYGPDLGAIPIRCSEHPDSKLEAFFDAENRTLVINCAQCEKILVEQPIP